MDKKMIEHIYLKEVEASHFYQLRYINCDKSLREYELCRQRHLQHKKTAEYYKNMIMKVD